MPWYRPGQIVSRGESTDVFIVIRVNINYLIIWWEFNYSPNDALFEYDTNRLITDIFCEEFEK